MNQFDIPPESESLASPRPSQKCHCAKNRPPKWIMKNSWRTKAAKLAKPHTLTHSHIQSNCGSFSDVCVWVCVWLWKWLSVSVGGWNWERRLVMSDIRNMRFILLNQIKIWGCSPSVRRSIYRKVVQSGRRHYYGKFEEKNSLKRWKICWKL